MLPLSNAMRNKKLYKNTIGFILLALYILISMPVGLWHKHNTNIIVAKKYGFSSKNDLNKQYIEQASITEEDSCLLCNHQFSAYINANVLVYYFNSNVVYSVYNTENPNTYLYYTYTTNQNRGPPQG